MLILKSLDGLNKDNIIIWKTGDPFMAKNLTEVMWKSHEAHEKVIH